MIDPLQVTVSPDEFALRAGQGADLEVTIQNTGRAVEHYTTSLLGVPDSCWRVGGGVVKLQPGESTTVGMRLTLPERPGLADGPYVLGVLVRSPHKAEVSRCVEVRLQVAAEPALRLSSDRAVAHGRTSADFRLSVVNEGTTALVVALHGHDDEQALSYEFTPRSLEVAPGSTGQSALTLHGERPWTGQERSRRATVTATAGRDVTDAQTLTFMQKPRLAGGVLKVTGMAVGVGVLATSILGGTVGAALLTRPKQQAVHAPATPPPQRPSAPVVLPPPTSAAAAPPSTAPSAATPSTVSTGPTIVDFAQSPDGGTGDRLIPPDTFTATTGVTLSTVVDGAPDACKDATALALRTRGKDVVLTSARPSGFNLCNSLPVKLTLSKPVTSVRLVLLGITVQPNPAPSGQRNTYTLTVDLTDGSAQEVDGIVADGTLSTLAFDAPAGSAITSVTFGHPTGAGGTTPGTAIRKVTFTGTG